MCTVTSTFEDITYFLFIYIYIQYIFMCVYINIHILYIWGVNKLRVPVSSIYCACARVCVYTHYRSNV